MKTNSMIENAPQGEQPWWFVRMPLLVALVALSALLTAIFTPTPLNEWIFGEGFAALAGR